MDLETITDVYYSIVVIGNSIFLLKNDVLTTAKGLNTKPRMTDVDDGVIKEAKKPLKFLWQRKSW